MGRGTRSLHVSSRILPSEGRGVMLIASDYQVEGWKVVLGLFFQVIVYVIIGFRQNLILLEINSSEVFSSALIGNL